MSSFASKSLRVVFALSLLSLSGCESWGPAGSKVAAGTLIGLGTGAVVTAATGGCVPCGIAIGGAAGAGAGYIYHFGTRRSGR